MNSPPAMQRPTGPFPQSDCRGALDALLRRITWRVVATTIGIAIALDTWSVFDIANETIPQIPPVEAYLSGTVVNLFMAFCIMFTTLVADEMVARGARRLPAYACAVVIGCAAAVLAQWQVHQWLNLRNRYEVPGVRNELLQAQPLAIFCEYLMWGGTIVLIYANHRSALLASARMNAAQVERAHAQRRTLQARLQALQALVEPQFLFNTLTQVRDLYDRDRVSGGEMLRDLILYLRAALPRLRDSSSTLEQEISLASAYLSIVRVQYAGRLVFDVSASRVERAARVPPMILLPLLEQALAKGIASPFADVAIRVAAEIAVGRLRLKVTHSGNGFSEDNDGARVIRDRLRALYGENATLVFGTPVNGGTQAIVEVPHESTDSGHR